MHFVFPVAAMVMLLPITAAAEVPQADFSAGLEMLAKLGLPEMKGARWVKRPKAAGEGFESSYQFRELKVRLQGGAWQLAEDPRRLIEFAGTAGLSSGDGEKKEQEEAPAAKPGLFEKMLRTHAAQQPKKKPKPKPGPSLEKDVGELVEALGNPAIMNEIVERMEYSRAEIPGRLLVFAAQLHAAGEKDHANRLAGALFAAIPDKTVVIDAAIAHFAGSEYDSATKAFFQGHDWKTYYRDLTGLLAKYPRGWSDSLAVAMLMPALEKRAREVPPPEPSIAGVELNPEALKALADLLEPSDTTAVSDEELARNQGVDLGRFPAEQRAEILAMLRMRGMNMDSGGSDLWILEPAPDTKPTSPTGRLRALGMDGLIALAAVATDDTLAPVPNSGSRSSYFSSRDTAEEIARRQYRAMNRPQSRGEIATALLASTVPRADDDEPDPELLRDAAVTFWREHRTKSPVELAAVFLSGGNDIQRQQAASFLATSDDPEAAPSFEKIVLAADDPSGFAREVEAYLDRKKAAAKPFFDAFAKNLTEAMDGIDLDDMRYSSGSYAIREAGSVEKYLKKLSVKVGSTSLKELVDDALKAEPGDDEESPIAGLAPTVAGTPIAETLEVFGGAMATATEPQRMEIHMLLLRLSSRFERDDESPGLPAEALAPWKPLVANDAPLPDDDPFGSWAKSYGATNAGDGSCLVLELIVRPESGDMFNAYGNVAGGIDKVGPFIRQRVDAWIDGKEPPDWPDPDKVSDGRKQEIRDKLAGLAAKDIAAFAESLTLDERMALTGIIGDFDDDNPAPAGLLALRDTVTGTRPFNLSMPHDPGMLEQFGIGEGYRVTGEGLKGIAERLVADAKTTSGSAVSFFTAPMHLGYIASASRTTGFDPETVRRTGLPSLARWFDFHDNPEALAMLSVGGSADFWTVKDGKAILLESRDSALEQLSNAASSKSLTNLYIQIQVLTREDAEKINIRN